MERLAFSNFGEVVSVFKGRHEFNRRIRNGKKQVKIFPVAEDPMILPREISFHGSIQKEKVVLCYRCKTWHILGENCPEAAPTPRRFWHVFHWAEWYSSREASSCRNWVNSPQLKASPLVEETGRENFLMRGTSSDSDSGSGSESSANTDS